MKVVLPDASELELPEGATGLDAARAIGPKLAEQAVLVRTNGRVRDVRLPLEDGQPVQVLTTRDKDDPDALAVLRHSSAHLLAEAVRRLYPGVKLAIGPRPASAELQADQGAQADRPRRRVLARRLVEAAADADLRHRLLRQEGPRRVPRAARGGEAPRPPTARDPARPLSLRRALARVAV